VGVKVGGDVELDEEEEEEGKREDLW